MRVNHFSTALFAVVALPSFAFAAPIKVLNDGYGNSGSQVNFADGSRINDFGYQTQAQDLERAFGVDNGWSSSSANSAWTMTDNAAQFDLAFSQARTNGEGVFSRTLIGTMRFYATEDTVLDLSGAYSTAGLGKSVYTVRLVDNVTGDVLLDVSELTKWSDGEQFSAGLTTFLAAGSDVRLYFDAYVMAPSTGEYSPTYGGGFGSLSLAFTGSKSASVELEEEPMDVAAPGALGLLGLGFAALGVAGFRRRA